MIFLKKLSLTLIMLFSLVAFSQTETLVEKSVTLNQKGAFELFQQVNLEAKKIDKNVSVAILNSQGVVLLLVKGDNVGPHNTEASRRKAFTSVSTKTPSLELMQNAAKSSDAKNLNTLPELLLLGGGAPVFYNGELIGSVGVSGGGGSENDHLIAIKAIANAGFKSAR